MGIADLLQSLGVLGGQATGVDPNAGAAPAPAAAAPAAGGGVGQMLAPPAQAPAAPQAAPTPAPSTPPPSQGGLGDFLASMVHKATTRNPDSGLSFIDKVGQIGDHITDGAGTTQGAEAQDQADAASRVAQTQAAAKRAQLMQMADGLGMTPREKLIFTADPDAWVKANASGLESRVVGGGDSVVNGATGAATTAPRVGQEKGEAFAITPSGAKDLGGLAISPQQTSEDDVKAAQQEAMATYHAAMARAAQQNANSNATRANKPKALGNGGDWRSRVVGQGSVQ